MYLGTFWASLQGMQARMLLDTYNAKHSSMHQKDPAWVQRVCGVGDCPGGAASGRGLTRGALAEAELVPVYACVLMAVPWDLLGHGEAVGSAWAWSPTQAWVCIVTQVPPG